MGQAGTDWNTYPGFLGYAGDGLLFQIGMGTQKAWKMKRLFQAMRAGAEALFPGWRVLGVKRFRFRHFIEPGEYDYAFTPQPDAAAIRCVLLSGGRRMAEGTLLVAAEPVRGEA